MVGNIVHLNYPAERVQQHTKNWQWAKIKGGTRSSHARELIYQTSRKIVYASPIRRINKDLHKGKIKIYIDASDARLLCG